MGNNRNEVSPCMSLSSRVSNPAAGPRNCSVSEELVGLSVDEAAEQVSELRKRSLAFVCPDEPVPSGHGDPRRATAGGARLTPGPLASRPPA